MFSRITPSRRSPPGALCSCCAELQRCIMNHAIITPHHANITLTPLTVVGDRVAGASPTAASNGASPSTRASAAQRALASAADARASSLPDCRRRMSARCSDRRSARLRCRGRATRPRAGNTPSHQSALGSRLPTAARETSLRSARGRAAAAAASIPSRPCARFSRLPKAAPDRRAPAAVPPT